MFDWLSDAVDWIGNSVNNATENAASAFSETILYTILEWIYSLIFDTISQIFVMLNTTSEGIFQLGWANAFLRFFYCIGWALFAAGVIVAVFDTAIEYQNGRGRRRTAAGEMLPYSLRSSGNRKSLPTFAEGIGRQIASTGSVPFCISLQETFANDLAAAFFGESFMDIGSLAVKVMGNYDGTSGLLGLLTCIVLAYCVLKLFFANLKRGGILLCQIAVGSLYMFSVPRGYTDGFYGWCKQVIALCLTSFLQTTLLFLGLLTWQTNMILAIGVMLSANEVPRIAQQFGLDTSVHVNMMSVTSTVNSAVRAGTMVARAVR